MESFFKPIATVTSLTTDTLFRTLDKAHDRGGGSLLPIILSAFAIVAAANICAVFAQQIMFIG